MNINNSRLNIVQKYTVPLLVIALFAGVWIGYGVNAFVGPQRQIEIATRGAQVMPFDLDKTTHVFERVADGGLQTVTADMANDQGQIQLIREHLRKEADAFRRGDFSDPARIHGYDMPGLKALRAGASRISVEYSDVPNGAQIKYVTSDTALIHALHQWFDAQLADHGEHAQDGMQH